MLASLLSLLTLATIAVAAFGLGRPLVRALGVGENDALEVGVFSVGAGFVAGGTLLAALGFAGLLHKSVIAAFSLSAALYGIAQLGHDVRRWRTARKSGDGNTIESRSSPPSRPLRQAMFWLAATAAVGSLVAALAPPTAGDALCYHLELPKRFLLEHALVYLPDSDNSAFPLLAEMGYLWALALDGAVAAQLVHWAMGLLLALGAVVLGTPILGRSWSWCAAAAVLATPGVNNQMTAPLNDLAVAAMATLSLAAWWRAAVDREDRRWYVLAGWFAGGALATKYLALLYVAAAAAVTVFAVARRGQWCSLLRGSAVAAIVAASVGGPWYLRSAWHTGNPVYPFFHDSVSRLWSTPAKAGVTSPSLRASHPTLRASSLRDLPIACWHVTMHPERFGGRGHQWGVLFLATLPALVFCRRLRGLRMLLSISLVYLAGWHLLRPNVRFLLPIVPLLCIAVVWAWMEWRRLPAAPRRCLACLTGAVLAVGAAIAPLRAKDRWPVALGIETRDAYLLRREPSYQAAAWVNALLTPEARILSQEQRAFYFRARVARENVYRRRTGYDRNLPSPDALAPTLRAEGFTHLLLAEGLSGDVHYNSTLTRLADAALAARAASMECLVEFDAVDAPGALRRYRLVRLCESSLPLDGGRGF